MLQLAGKEQQGQLRRDVRVPLQDLSLLLVVDEMGTDMEEFGLSQHTLFELKVRGEQRSGGFKVHSIFGMNVASSWQENITPQTTVLIVYDMQAGIASQIPAGKEIIRKVGLLLAAARTAGVRVFFTRHLSLPKELMGVSQYRTAMAWQRVASPEKVRPIFARDSPAFQIVPELAPRSSEGIVDKIAMSAFEGTFLATALRDCGIRSFIIAGIALEIGIDPTCRQGADLGFWPILIEDACGFGNQEAAEHSIASLRHMGDTTISNVDSVCRLLEKSTSGD